MANTPQAKKRIRRNNRRAEINGARVSRLRRSPDPDRVADAHLARIIRNMINCEE